MLSTASILVAAACGGSRPALDRGDGAALDATVDATVDATGGTDRANDAGAPIDAAAPDGGDAGVAIPDAGSVCTPAVEARVPAAPLQRLSSFEYTNTVRDVLGLTLAPASLPGDPSEGDTAALGTLIDAFHGIAHDFGVAATKDAASVSAIAPCDVSVLGETTCAQRFIDAFVSRVFRRPLEPEDATDFADVFAKGREQGGDYASGVRAVIEVALQSPEFLYRVEVGELVDPSRPGLGRPRPYEMASRLSYLLLGSAPDDGLLKAAAQDQLRTKDAIEQQARRLVADRRSHDVTRNFYARLLGTSDLTNRHGLSGDLPRLAAEETARVVDQVVWTEGGDLKTLLTAPFSFVDGTLAQLYGIPNIVGPEIRRVALPSGQRMGVLTQAGVVASSSAGITNPSERGALILRQLLCGDLPPTPDAGTHVKPAIAAGETVRGWLERVTAPDGCRSCHQRIDPIGFAFEHYAATGAWRDTDATLSIDARGTLTGIDAAGGFDGALELIARLSASRDVHTCHVQKWMEAAYGRQIVDGDGCSRLLLEQAFLASGGNIRELMIALTQTEAFLYRPVP
jgi:hypothetical protein